MGNSPIQFNDEKGDVFGLDNLVAAAVSGVAEYGVQVTSNYLEGKANPWTDVSVGKIGVAIVAGGLSDGLSETAVFAKLGANGAKLANKALPYVIDAGKSVANQIVDGKDVSVLKVVSDVGLSKIAGEASKKLTPKIANTDTKVLTNQADRAKRVAGNSPRPSRAANVQEKTKELNNANQLNKVVNIVNKVDEKYIKNDIKKGTETIINKGTETMSGGNTGSPPPQQIAPPDNTRVSPKPGQ